MSDAATNTRRDRIRDAREATSQAPLKPSVPVGRMFDDRANRERQKRALNERFERERQR